MKAKNMKKRPAPMFGTPEYLKATFDDIVDAVESRKSKTARDFKSRVEGLSTPKDMMRVQRVVKTMTRVCGAPARVGYVAWVALGLNGHGSQSDYLEAVKRLVDKSGAPVLEIRVDLLDDLMDILVRIS